MGVNADNAATKMVQHGLPLTGSKITTYRLSLTASYADLVASANGKGTLVAIGNRASATTADRFLDSVRITCDGGTPVAFTGMAGSDGEFFQVAGSLPGTTTWMPVDLPFNTSIQVEALRNAGSSGTSYAYAVIRWVV